MRLRLREILIANTHLVLIKVILPELRAGWQFYPMQKMPLKWSKSRRTTNLDLDLHFCLFTFGRAIPCGFQPMSSLPLVRWPSDITSHVHLSQSAARDFHALSNVNKAKTKKKANIFARWRLILPIANSSGWYSLKWWRISPAVSFSWYESYLFLNYLWKINMGSRLA